jgi:hypothetical protein
MQKKDVEAEGQQDELGNGLNLVNCGMYLDVTNADVSQSVIGSELVYSLFVQCSYQFVHFIIVVFTVQRKPLPMRPHQNHIPKYMKSTKNSKNHHYIDSKYLLSRYMRPFETDQKCTTTHPPLYYY